MLTSAAIAHANHLLRAENWVCDRLQMYSGKSIRIRIPPLIDLKLCFNAAGELRLIDEPVYIVATLTISPLILPGLLIQNPDAYKQIKITGDKDCAEELIAMAQQIDLTAIFTHDLSNVIGDIPAYRLGRAGKRLLRWQSDSLDRITQTVAEYVIEEKNFLMKPEAIQQFSEQIQNLQHDTEQLEQRLVCLMRHDVFHPPA